MRLIILGSGGYGHTVEDMAMQLEYDCLVLDDSIHGYSFSTFVNYTDSQTEFILAFGNNAFRMQWIEKLVLSGAKITTLIHPTAYISPKAIIEEGTVILPKASVNTDVTIHRGGV